MAETRRQRKKRAMLRAGFGGGVGFGIGSYNSPIGDVTGVDVPVMGPQFPGGGGPCVDTGGSVDSGGAGGPGPGQGAGGSGP